MKLIGINRVGVWYNLKSGTTRLLMWKNVFPLPARRVALFVLGVALAYGACCLVTR